MTRLSPMVFSQEIAPMTKLETLERRIERGLMDFVEVGNALAEISREHLYRDQGFGTFAEYCEQRWGFARQTAYFFIQAAGVQQNVSPGRQQALTFTQAKELVVLSPAKQKDFVATHPVTTMTRRELALEVAKVRRAELNLAPSDEPAYQPYITFADELPDNCDVIVCGPMIPRGVSLHLREGGSLLVVLAPFDLNRVDDIEPVELHYHWTIALVTGSGPPIMTEQARMYGMWTPVVWYVKGQYRGDFLPDVYDHIATFVRKLTRPDDVVAEVGSQTGALAIACAKGRVKWVGVNTDAAAQRTISRELGL